MGGPSKYISTETTDYPGLGRTVEDVYMKEDGTLFVNTYNLSFNGERHDHAAVDENGNYLGGHPEDEREWKDRRYLLNWLESLSFYELQMVESLTNNEYVRKSANYLINFSINKGDELPFENTKKLIKFKR